MNQPADLHFQLPARWLCQPGFDPIENALISVEDGIVTSVSAHRQKSDLCVIPPLVNAHTHLELSDLKHPLAAHDHFPDWIRQVITHRHNRPSETAAVSAGFEELFRHGTLQVADTVSQRADIGHDHPINVLHFVEYIGLDAETVRDALAHARVLENSAGSVGISPHAPYSVDPDFLEALVAIARAKQLPVMMHLAETRDELELIRAGTGRFRDMLSALGLWRDQFGGQELIDYLDRLAPAPRVLLAHFNYPDESSIDFVRRHPAFSVVFCPRTHAYFGHARHPWRELVANGVNVALGTDSRASNPDLNVWEEALFLSRRFGASPSQLLQMATDSGAIALGTDPGRIEPGRPASFSLLRCPPDTPDGWRALMSSRAVGACREGRWLRSP